MSVQVIKADGCGCHKKSSHKDSNIKVINAGSLANCGLSGLTGLTGITGLSGLLSTGSEFCHRLLNLYEIISTPLTLRSTPNTLDPTNVLQVLDTNVLVDRLDNQEYADAALGSGIIFFRVRVSANPNLVGFLPARQTIVAPGAPTTFFLAKTASALAAEKILNHKDKPKHHKKGCKKIKIQKCKSTCSSSSSSSSSCH